MQDKYLGFSGQKNMAIWLAVNEKGVSLLNTTLSVSGGGCGLHHTVSILTMPSLFFNYLQKVYVSYAYNEVATFGGHGEDFMLVVNSQHRPTLSRSSPSLQTEKILLSMPKMKVGTVVSIMFSWENVIGRLVSLYRFVKQPTSWPATWILRADVFFFTSQFIFNIGFTSQTSFHFYLPSKFYLYPLNFFQAYRNRSIQYPA